MNIEQKKQQIIDDLLELDPGLKKHQESLEKVISQLLAAKPNIELDERFREKLHGQIQEKISASKRADLSLWNVMPLWKKLSLSGSFLTLVLLIFGMIFFSSQQYQTGKQFASKEDQELEKAADAEIIQREAGAFGQLKASPSPQTAEAERGRGGGVSAEAGSSEIAAAGPSQLVPGIPAPRKFVFSYEGETISINQKKSEVLRRIKELDFGDLGGMITSIDNGLLDLNSLSDTKIQSLSIAEEKPYGLFVNFSAEDGSISINQNWKQWNLECGIGGCPPKPNLAPSDVPADQILVSIADEFVQRHGINMVNFEAGQVDQQWNRYIGIPENESSAQLYVPEELAVVYPLKIGERKVYNRSGTREGLRVQVNIRLLRASGLYGLTTQQYESSLYETETDFKRLVQIAENEGSPYPMPLMEPGITPERDNFEIVQLQLGTPSYVFMKHWHYDGKETQQLIVPALAFPIENSSQNGYYQDNILVPLVKDLLEQQ